MVKDQHEKITGYRNLTEDDIATMNRIKAAEGELALLWHAVTDRDGVDQRCLAIARTNLEDAFMWFNRAVARPVSPFDSTAEPAL